MAADTLAEVMDVARSLGREDLSGRLEKSLTEIERQPVTVALAGEFKQGKSTLVNALLATKVCPSDDLVSTTAPTYVRWGPHASASVTIGEVDGEGTPTGKERQASVPIHELNEWATELRDSKEPGVVRKVDVTVKRRLLQSGLCLLDTPGVGGLESGIGELVLGSLASSDAMLLVTDALHELTEPEINFAREAGRRCPRSACVVTKIDLSPRWRQVVERNTAHLRSAGFQGPVFPVSSFLRLRAAASKDDRANQESGFAPLLAFLAQEVVKGAREKAATEAVAQVSDMSRQINVQLAAEREVLARPEAAAGAIEHMRDANRQATRLTSSTANWQQTLRDGVLDLSSDVQHDLQERMRQILEQADELVDRSDPAEQSDQIQAWVERQVGQAVVATFDLLTSRTATLSDQVAAHFTAEIPDSLAPAAVVPSPKVLAGLELDMRTGPGPKASESAINAARGTYSGAMMLGFAANLIALPFALPVTLAAGLLLGGKAFRDDKKRQLERRRVDAKRAVHRYVQRAATIADKEVRDGLRTTERTLRDTFQLVAQQLTTASAQALRRMEMTTQLGEDDRRSRLATVEHQMERVATIERRAAAVVG